jgi:hypothetical protein
MATWFAQKDGNWSANAGAQVWNSAANGSGSWGALGNGDTADSNGFTITIDVSPATELGSTLVDTAGTPGVFQSTGNITFASGSITLAPTGVLNVVSGKLLINTGGNTLGGTVTVYPAAELQIDNSTTVSATGVIAVASGGVLCLTEELTVAGEVDVLGLCAINGGGIALTNILTINSGGILAFGGEITISDSGVLTVEAAATLEIGTLRDDATGEIVLEPFPATLISSIASASPIVFASGSIVKFFGIPIVPKDYVVAAANVRNTVARWAGASGAGNVGTVVIPAVSKVKDGEFYGAGGTQYEGTYDPQAADYSDPGTDNVRSGEEYLYAGDTQTGTMAGGGILGIGI